MKKKRIGPCYWVAHFESEFQGGRFSRRNERHRASFSFELALEHQSRRLLLEFSGIYERYTSLIEGTAKSANSIEAAPGHLLQCEREIHISKFFVNSLQSRFIEEKSLAQALSPFENQEKGVLSSLSLYLAVGCPLFFDSEIVSANHLGGSFKGSLRTLIKHQI